MKGSILFVLLLTCSACSAKAQVTAQGSDSTVRYGHNPAAARYYHVRGIDIYTEEYGTGTPLLMIHGNNGSGASFRNIIPAFSKNYRVIIADSRSQGQTVDQADSLSFEMIADDEAALLDAMHIDSALVLGASDGGIVALLLAMRHPEKVIKLAETGADLVPDSTRKAVVYSSWIKEKKFYDDNVNRVFTSAEEKRLWKVKMLDWRQPDVPFDSLKNIRCPSLIISGDHDMFRVEHALDIYHHIPKAYLWVVPNSGHGTLSEHTADFIRTIDEFFKQPFKERNSYIL